MNDKRQRVSLYLRTLGVLCASALSFFLALYARSNPAGGARQDAAPFRGQSQEEANRKSAGCISSHTSTDEPTMHPTKTVHIRCADSHGGTSSPPTPPPYPPTTLLTTP